ncbi:MAG: hypothetical protein A2156_03450 [Deltaproteobacteria bacterium RBG_16_48_10]|nr:MAG: hypothetical protein A2156_03450 [Deltaproteobacteria bacterium RBG_16_48_10]
MKRASLFYMVCLCLELVMGNAAGFSEEVLQEKALSLKECIQIALKNRPELEFSTLDIVQAEQQIKEATAYYFPRLNLALGYTYFNRPLEFNVDIDLTELKRQVQDPIIRDAIPDVLPQHFETGKKDWFAWTVDLTQPVFTFGRIKEGISQARIGRSIAVNQKEKKKAEITFEVKKSYYQFLLAKEIFQLLKEAEIGTDVVARMVKIAYETAVPEKDEKGTTRLDYLKARNFHSEVKARLSEAGKNSKLAQLAMQMAMGLYTDSSLKVTEVPLEGFPMNVLDFGELKGSTLEKNIDLKNINLGVMFLDSKRKAASKEYFPKVGLFGNYVGPEDRFGNSNLWYAGIGLTMPLFDGFLTKAKVGQAEAQFQKVKGQKMLLESALSAQVDHLHTTLLELKERAAILRASLREAKERTQLAADGYASGITEYEELLLAQKTELEMKANYLQGLFLFQMTKAEIEFISGIQ